MIVQAQVRLFEKSHVSTDVEICHALSSAPINSWDSVLFSNIDIEFLRELDIQFEQNATAVAETIVRIKRSSHSILELAIPLETSTLAYESAKSVFDSARLGHAELQYAEERLARCLYLAGDDVLRVKVLYC